MWEAHTIHDGARGGGGRGTRTLAHTTATAPPDDHRPLLQWAAPPSHTASGEQLGDSFRFAPSRFATIHVTTIMVCTKSIHSTALCDATTQIMMCETINDIQRIATMSSRLPFHRRPQPTQRTQRATLRHRPLTIVSLRNREVPKRVGLRMRVCRGGGLAARWAEGPHTAGNAPTGGWAGVQGKGAGPACTGRAGQVDLTSAVSHGGPGPGAR